MPAFTDRLNIPIPALGEDPWRSLYVDAFQMVDEILGRIHQAGGLTFVRRWQSSGDGDGRRVVTCRPVRR